MLSGEGKERSGVASKAKCRETTTMKCTSRECHRYHSLLDWSELAFLLSERSSSENRARSAGVTESTIIATIHCPDIGYCLFGISLVMHIPYHVPCTFPIVIVAYWVVFSFARLFIPLAPCTQLRYSTLPTMYYWISTSVAISCLFDSITCFVSYILSPLYLCFRT